MPEQSESQLCDGEINVVFLICQTSGSALVDDCDALDANAIGEKRKNGNLRSSTSLTDNDHCTLLIYSYISNIHL